MQAIRSFEELRRYQDSLKAARDPNFWEDTFWPVSVKLRTKITEHADDIELFKTLTTIKCDADYKEIKKKRDMKIVGKYLRLYEFKSLYSPLELKKLSMLAR